MGRHRVSRRAFLRGSGSLLLVVGTGLAPSGCGDDDDFVSLWRMIVADPALCGAMECSEAEFECDDGTCIPKSWVCDGVWDDCAEAEDEDPSACEDAPPECTEAQYSCYNGDCIEPSQACDGTWDCVSGEDEIWETDAYDTPCP